MTRKEMFYTAMKQSAEDMGCRPEDFMREDNVITAFRLGRNARKYLTEPITGNFVSYGSNTVAAVSDEIRDIVTEYLKMYKFYFLFGMPSLNWLNDRLSQAGYRISNMAAYYLPDSERIPDIRCGYETRVLVQEDFAELYLPQWGNALCEDRKELDVLGVGAYDDGELIALAACSADCDDMWQIGVDVLPAYRRRGIATLLLKKMLADCEALGKALA